MAGRSPRAAAAREGAHPHAGRAQRRPAPAADGADRQGLPLRGSRRRGRRWPISSRAGASSCSSTSCSTPRGTTAARVARRMPTSSPQGLIEHLHVRDTTFAAVSRAPFAKLDAYRVRKGWDIPVVLVVRQRLQLRLPHHDRRVGRAARGQLPRPRRDRRRRVRELGARGAAAGGDARHQLLPARGRRRVPHVLDVRARHRGDRRRVRLSSISPRSVARRNGRSPRAGSGAVRAATPDFAS